ncbi:MAG: 5'-methylthioadenosine/adenosylhomocysteine nucleosidase, partial [Succinivibrio sp.]|nr:5'-methylthioadenosine/adenosylhomocysteine nucleosidase [Succinivibrio sp.]
MKIGIIGAMDPEVDTLVNELKNPQQQQIGYAQIFEGELCGHNVVIARSGIGKVCAGSITALMIALFKVDCIVNTGCAGGISNNLKIGDTVLSSKVAFHDCDLTIFGYSKGQMANHSLYFEADQGLIRVAFEAANSLDAFKGAIHKGVILSGDQFISDQDKKLELVETFPEAMATEMEGAAIAQVASDFKKPFIVIRAISDGASEGTP